MIHVNFLLLYLQFLVIIIDIRNAFYRTGNTRDLGAIYMTAGKEYQAGQENEREQKTTTISF